MINATLPTGVPSLSASQLMTEAETEAAAQNQKDNQKKKNPSKKATEAEEQEQKELQQQLEMELAKEEVSVPCETRSESDSAPKLDEFALFLPPLADVLEGLGMGPNGPPLPEPATFSVITYPGDREAPKADGERYFEFLGRVSIHTRACLDYNMVQYPSHFKI